MLVKIKVYDLEDGSGMAENQKKAIISIALEVSSIPVESVLGKGAG